MITICLYGKPGCHLCDDVRSVVISRQPTYEFQLHEFNIMEDEELFDRYVVDIPVVTINGEYFCQYSIDTQAFDKKLTSLTEGKK